MEELKKIPTHDIKTTVIGIAVSQQITTNYNSYCIKAPAVRQVCNACEFLSICNLTRTLQFKQTRTDPEGSCTNSGTLQIVLSAQVVAEVKHVHKSLPLQGLSSSKLLLSDIQAEH